MRIIFVAFIKMAWYSRLQRIQIFELHKIYRKIYDIFKAPLNKMFKDCNEVVQRFQNPLEFKPCICLRAYFSQKIVFSDKAK